MNDFKDLQERGLIYDLTDEKGIKELPKNTAFYLGLDPTAPNLHIGHLVPLISSIRLGQLGFSPIILFGGATGAIGDPSGRNTERTLLTREEIDFNVECHKDTVRQIFERANVKVDFVNNHDWTKDVTVLTFLRDIGKYFTISYMLAKDSVKNRLATDSLSFTEMSYMLLQSFDFLHLYENKNCRMQVGASDQFGNMTAGLELIRKKGSTNGDAYAISFPLLTDSQGKKFGKSTGGVTWINKTGTSPYRFHQFWINTPDDDIEKFSLFFSLRSIAEIKSLIAESKKTPEKRIAQNALADEMCDLVHGSSATKEAKQCAQVFFGGDIRTLTHDQIADVFADAPSVVLDRADIFSKTSADILVASNIVKSKGEARRLITDGGAYLNSERITDANYVINEQQLLHNKYLVFRSGKKNYALVSIK